MFVVDFETISVAAKRSEQIDPVSAVDVMFGFLTVLAFALSIAKGNFIAPSTLASPLRAVVAFILLSTIQGASLKLLKPSIG